MADCNPYGTAFCYRLVRTVHGRNRSKKVVRSFDKRAEIISRRSVVRRRPNEVGTRGYDVTWRSRYRKEARIAHALLLADFRVPVAGVERTCVRNEVGGGGGALIDGLVETIRQVSDRQFGGGQLGKLRQRRTILAATATTHPTPNKQQSSEPF